MIEVEVPGLDNPYCLHGGTHVFCPYSPEQHAFSSSPAFEVFFGGSAGPGKTIVLAHEGLRYVDHRSYRAIFFRRTFDELKQVIELTHETFPYYDGRYNETQHTWAFPVRGPAIAHNILRGKREGARFHFAYCARDSDKYRHQGQAYQFIAWDEITQYPNDSVYTYLFFRCRPLDLRDNIPCYVRSGANPGGPGHAWVKQRFIEGKESNIRYRIVVEDPVTGKKLSYLREWVKATLDSNDIYMEKTNYEVQLLAYPDPELRRAMRHGDWDIAAGLMFAELRDGVHRIPAREPLEWTQKDVTIDWGYEHYAAAGWFETTSGIADAVPHSIQYRELVMNHTPPPLFAQTLCDVTPQKETIKRVLMDSAAWATPQDGGPSPAEQMLPYFKKRGWNVAPTVKGAGSRARGWHLLHTYYYPKRRGGPLLRHMDNCPVTWRQMTSLARGEEPHDIEDLEPRQQDDAADMVRYFVQGRPQPAPPTPDEILATDEDLDKMIDPASYEAAKIEELRRLGFPAVRVGVTPKKPSTSKPWSPA